MAPPLEPATASARVRLGILGLGAVAQAVHLPIIERLHDHFEIGAIADLSMSVTQAVGDRFRVPPANCHTSLDALLDEPGLDALVVLTTGSHGGPIMAGLDRRLAVFAEKPLAYTVAEADAIAMKLAADPGLKLQVGYMKLYDPAVIRARQTASDQRFGSPRAIEVTVLHPSAESQLSHARLLPSPTDIPESTRTRLSDQTTELRGIALGEAAADRFGPLYANILLGSVVHELALVRAFAGDPTTIDHVATWPDGAWPPSVGLTGQLPHDGRVTIDWHFLPDYPAYREEVRVIYDTATIELSFPSPYLLHRPTVLRVSTAVEGAWRDEAWTSTVEAFEEELLAFHGLVAEGQSPLVGVEAGRADIVTCQRAIATLARTQGVAIGGEAAR